MKTPIFYHPAYNVDLGLHVFPSIKYREVEKRLKSSDFNNLLNWKTSKAISKKTIKLAHDPYFVNDILSCKRTAANSHSELPLTPNVVKGFELALAGTVNACEHAIKSGRAINLGGGFHHASRNKAEGFCLFNDVAVSARYLKEKKLAQNILIIDLDVHQGNGTALMSRGHSEIFSFSMHQENNYPKKEKSSLDIGLEDLCSDDEYLRTLEEALIFIENKFNADFILYLAGADIFMDDKLGGLKITKGAIIKRDKIIIDYAKKRNIPLALVLAGGYAYNTQDTVDIHYNTIKELVLSWKQL